VRQKRPGWTPENLRNAVLGRSHRSKLGKARLKAAIDRTREVLEVPDDFLIGIVPGSDTGAVEMAMWSMLGRARCNCWPSRASARTGSPTSPNS
jgi:phosphoserine aminotransferase